MTVPFAGMISPCRVGLVHFLLWQVPKHRTLDKSPQFAPLPFDVLRVEEHQHFARFRQQKSEAEKWYPIMQGVDARLLGVQFKL